MLSGGVRPRRRLLHLVQPQGDHPRCSKRPTRCSGIPRTTRASRARTTSSTPARSRISICSRWSSICWAVSGRRLSASARTISGPGRIIASYARRSAPNGGAVIAERYFHGRLHRVRPSHRGDPGCAPLVRLQHAHWRILLPSSSAICGRLRGRGIDQAGRDPGRKLYPLRAWSSRRSALGRRRPHHLERLLLVTRHARERPLRQAYRARFPEGPVVSADAEATYLAVRLLARAVTEARRGRRVRGQGGGGAAHRLWRRRAKSASIAETMHASLTPRIARSNPEGSFTITARSDDAPSAADPYLIRNSSRFGAVAIRPAPAGRLMTTYRLIQNFRRSQGLLWAGPDFNADALERTLLKLGVSQRPGRELERLRPRPRPRHRVSRRRSADQSRAARSLPGANLPAAPVIGIVGVEAPSRLKLLAEAGATAILRKPVQTATVYSAPFLA